MLVIVSIRELANYSLFPDIAGRNIAVRNLMDFSRISHLTVANLVISIRCNHL